MNLHGLFGPRVRLNRLQMYYGLSQSSVKFHALTSSSICYWRSPLSGSFSVVNNFMLGFYLFSYSISYMLSQFYDPPGLQKPFISYFRSPCFWPDNTEEFLLLLKSLNVPKQQLPRQRLIIYYCYIHSLASVFVLTWSDIGVWAVYHSSTSRACLAPARSFFFLQTFKNVARFKLNCAGV